MSLEMRKRDFQIYWRQTNDFFDLYKNNLEISLLSRSIEKKKIIY